MQDGVGRAAHGDVHGHRVFKGLEVGNAARQNGVITVPVIAFGQLDDGTCGFQEQLFAVGMGRQHRAVARQSQPQRLHQTVHRVGGEHARAAAAGRTGAALYFGHFFIAGTVVRTDHHGVDQVQRVLGQSGLARLHRPTGHEYHRNIQAQGGHQHAGGDLVAVGDADDGIGAVRVDHVLHRVGDDLAAGQGIQHAVVTHGDTIIHRDGIELLGHTTGLLDLTSNQLAHILQMHVTGHELGKGVGDGDDRLLEVFIFHTSGTPQRAGTGHIATVGGGLGAIIRHGRCLVMHGAGMPPSIAKKPPHPQPYSAEAACGGGSLPPRVGEPLLADGTVQAGSSPGVAQVRYTPGVGERLLADGLCRLSGWQA